MNNFYEEVLLREEYNLVIKLQKDKEFARYVDVKYEDRITGENRNVLMLPTANKYPEIYIVDYRMPVYVNVGQLRQDWHGKATITLKENVLASRSYDNGPNIKWETNFEPFNNHISDTWVCNGTGPDSAWAVAKDHGLWHLIIVMGKLINQEPDVSANAVHMSESAYDYWIKRGENPITNIRWPLDLLTKGDIVIETKIEKPEPKDEPKKKINIVKKTSGQSNPTNKRTIRIVSKSSQHPIKKISIIKKNNDG